MQFLSEINEFTHYRLPGGHGHQGALFPLPAAGAATCASAATTCWVVQTAGGVPLVSRRLLVYENQVNVGLKPGIVIGGQRAVHACSSSTLQRGLCQRGAGEPGRGSENGAAPEFPLGQCQVPTCTPPSCAMPSAASTTSISTLKTPFPASASTGISIPARILSGGPGRAARRPTRHAREHGAASAGSVARRSRPIINTWIPTASACLRAASTATAPPMPTTPTSPFS